MMPMYLDFSSILAIATLVSGFIWGVDAWVLRPRRVVIAATLPGAMKEPKLVEYARSFFPILLIVCLMRSFIAEPFRIPSGSMKPTLLEGDFILVNKFVYGIRLPIFGTKIINMKNPERGDVLVFRYPHDTSMDYIKRVIGVPGDKISYKDKTLYLNGEPLAQEFKGSLYDTDILGYNHQVKHFEEKLMNKPHSIYVHAGNGIAMDEVVVPEGNYFVMGDNRDNSEDSRVWGFVPEELILGKAFFIWMSWDPNAKDIRWQRIGHVVK